MNVRDMDALTLRALARELDANAAFWRTERSAYGKILSDRLEALAMKYRRRANLAKGGWAVAQQLSDEKRT